MRRCKAMSQRLLCPSSPRLAASPVVCEMHLLQNQHLHACQRMQGRCFIIYRRASPQGVRGGQQVQYHHSHLLASSRHDGDHRELEKGLTTDQSPDGDCKGAGSQHNL